MPVIPPLLLPLTLFSTPPLIKVHDVLSALIIYPFLHRLQVLAKIVLHYKHPLTLQFGLHCPFSIR